MPNVVRRWIIFSRPLLLVFILLSSFDLQSQIPVAFFQSQAPAGLTYSDPNPDYTKWTTITNNSPSTTSGAPVISWSISPALPSGLSFNTTTGVISGEPEASDEAGTDYTITASNFGGSTSVVMNIQVIIPDFTWLGGGGDADWSTAANWKGGVPPSSVDTPIFDDEGSSFPTTIDTSITVFSIEGKDNYTGTITQAGANTITVGTGLRSNPGCWRLPSGSFVGGSGNIAVDCLVLTGGTFTSTSGVLKLGVDNQFNTSGIGFNAFRLSSGATYNHNSGTFRLEGSSGSGTGADLRLNQIDLDQRLILNHFEFDLTRGAGHTRRAYGTIYGSVREIEVLGDLDFFDGWLYFGQIYFKGAQATFHCDSPSSPHVCSQTQNGYITDISNPLAGVVLRFQGSSAQTYAFDDGAGFTQFVIANPSGVSTTSIGDFNLNSLRIEDGDSFTAPSGTLRMGNGTRVDANFWWGFQVDSTGLFLHNNGTVEFSGHSNSSADLCFMKMNLGNTVEFYNLVIDILADADNNSEGGDEGYIGLGSTPGSFIVKNDFTMANGRIRGLDAGSRNIFIEGNYTSLCANAWTSDCADRSEDVTFYFDGASSVLSSAPLVAPLCFNCEVIVQPGKSLTIDGQLVMEAGSSTENIVVSDTASLSLNANSSVFVNDNLVNDGQITCDSSSYLNYSGGLSGTPDPGNNPLCYGAPGTGSDATPDAIDWPDFSGTSVLRSISSINTPIVLRLECVIDSGVPVIQYRKSWWWWFTTIGCGSTLLVRNGEGVRYRVNSTTNDEVTVSVYNQTDSDALLDTFTGSGSTPPDFVPNSTNWADFLTSSSTQTFAGINTLINVRLDLTYTGGTPTVEYQKNSNSWAAFSPGSPPTLGFVSGDTLRFRISGSQAESAQIQVINTSSGNTIIDTINAAVPDPTPSVMDWPNFSGSSSSLAFAGINQSITIQLTALYLSGTPTIEYQKNVGGWVSFTPGSPASVSVVSSDTLQMRVTGVSTESVRIQVINTSDGNTLLDSTDGTVP